MSYELRFDVRVDRPVPTELVLVVGGTRTVVARASRLARGGESLHDDLSRAITLVSEHVIDGEAVEFVELNTYTGEEERSGFRLVSGVQA